MNKWIVALLLMASINTATADEEIRYGWQGSYINFTIDDPDGSADSESEFNVMSVVMDYTLSRTSRILANLNLYEFDLDASTTKIGQHIETTSISSYYLHRFRWSRTFKPWLGLGLVVNMDDIDKRHRVDSDGFLVERFDDREETSIALGLIGALEFEIFDNWKTELFTEYQVPTSDTLEGLKIGFNIYF